MLTSEQIKEVAKKLGADLVGIGDLNRFEGVCREQDPRYIAPGAKSIIGLGFRVLRGSLRGIEEGTHYYQYPEMSVIHIDEVHAPLVLRKMACFLEDNGYEGVVQRSVPDRRPASDPGTNPERMPVAKLAYAEAVSPDKPAPDVLMDFRLGAYICGLGEIGYGGFFLTPQYGPLQRFAFILTDAPLEVDDIYAGPQLCDHCGKCITACPGKAISESETVELRAGDARIEHARLDEWQCSAYYMGANASTNPFLAPDALKDIPDGEKIAAGEKRITEEDFKALRPILNHAYSGMGHGYSASICGRACYRQCLIHLEERNILAAKFKTPFRTKPPWRLGK